MRSYHWQKGEVSSVFYLGALFFCFLAAMARPFSTVLSRNGKGRHPCLASDLWQSIQLFIIKCNVFMGFCLDALEQRKISFCSWSKFFLSLKNIWFCQMLSLPVEIPCGFVLLIVYVVECHHMLMSYAVLLG